MTKLISLTSHTIYISKYMLIAKLSQKKYMTKSFRAYFPFIIVFTYIKQCKHRACGNVEVAFFSLSDISVFQDVTKYNRIPLHFHLYTQCYIYRTRSTYIQYTYLLNYMPSTKCYVFCTTNVSRIQIWSPWDKYMREFDVELIYNSVELCLYILIYV